MTLQQVAKKACVSVSTASKALSDGKDVSEETKRRVLNAAKELGYFHESKKRQFENRRHTTFSAAIICPEIISVHYSQVVSAVCHRVYAHGGKASIFITGFDGEKVDEMIDRCVREKEIDAVICLETGGTYREKRPLPMPIVYLVKMDDACCVYPDFAGGIDKAVAALKEMGHQAIGFVGEPLTKRKEAAFRAAMLRHIGAIREDLIFCEEGRFERSGSAAAEKIVKKEAVDRPTAVIAAYDEIAYGLMHTLRTCGLHVPEDLSVVGMNDIPTSRFLEIPLTSLRPPTDFLADYAVELLLTYLRTNDGGKDGKDEKDGKGDCENAENRQNKIKRVGMSCELMLRDSTAAIPGKIPHSKKAKKQNK